MIRTVVLSLFPLLVLACGHATPEPVPAPVAAPVAEPAATPAPVIRTVTVTDTVQVKDPEARRRADRLELQLAEAEARITELETRLDAAHQDVVQTLRKSQGTASRAAAASGIAEAELAVQSPRGASAEDVILAKKLLRRGNDAFNEGNYAGALYLTTRARALASPDRRATGADLPPRAGERTFASPVPFRAARRGNVREGPGPGFRVRFVVNAGSEVTGYSYTEEWVRVADTSGRGGWIAKSLLARR